MQIVQDNTRRDLASLLQPANHHQTPAEVLSDPDLATYEKRVILSSWASDLYAVESCPWLRDVPGVRTTLRLSDILAALRALDDDNEPTPPGGVPMRSAGSRQKREPACWVAERSSAPRSL
jgi:hypothetical protein